MDRAVHYTFSKVDDDDWVIPCNQVGENLQCTDKVGKVTCGKCIQMLKVMNKYYK